MGIYPELDGLRAEDLYSKFEGRAPGADEPDYVHEKTIFYEEVAFLIIKKGGEPGYQYLLSKIASADTPRLQAILFALSIAKDHEQETIPILTRYLEDSNDSTVSEAIEGLTAIGDKNSYDRITAFLGHSSPYVRGSVLRYLAKIDGAGAMTTLKAALADPHYIVRESAIDEIDELEMTKLVHREIEHLMLNDPEQDVRDAAKTAIENIDYEMTIVKPTASYESICSVG